jgi:hypothetical protein
MNFPVHFGIPNDELMKRNMTVMKIKMIFIFNFILVASPFAAGNQNDPEQSKAEESEISYGAEMDFNDKYLWRGITYDDGFVLQPDVWISYRSFTFGIWGNVAAHGGRRSSKLNEVDLSLSYEYALLNLEIENSFMFYNYPNQSDSPPTGEFYFGIGYPIGDLKLVTNFSLDVVEYAGAFFSETGIEFNESLTKELSLNSSLILGWASRKFNEIYAGILKAAMNTISANIDFTYYPIAFLYLKPHVQVNQTIDKHLYGTLDKHSSVFGLLIGMEL